MSHTPNLARLTRKWQQILKLQDWRITARYAEPLELKEGVVGNCQFDLGLKRATILIRPWSEGDDPVEQTLLHELLHIYLPFCDDTELRSLLIEQAAESLAWSFYHLVHPEEK